MTEQGHRGRPEIDMSSCVKELQLFGQLAREDQRIVLSLHRAHRDSLLPPRKRHGREEHGLKMLKPDFIIDDFDPNEHPGPKTSEAFPRKHLQLGEAEILMEGESK